MKPTVDRKKLLLSAKNAEKGLRFTTEYISLPPEYWNDVIFSDETKITLYYHDGSQRVWRKLLTPLGNKNLIPTAQFEMLSIMVWGYIPSKGVEGSIVSIKKFGLFLTRLIRINSITNTIKIMTLNINLIYVNSGYYTTASKLLKLLTKGLILTLSKICVFI